MNDPDIEKARAAYRAELAKPPSQGAADRGWAAAAKIIREAEREACAKYCDEHQAGVPYGPRQGDNVLFSGHVMDPVDAEDLSGGRHPGMAYAAAIRARGGE